MNGAGGGYGSGTIGSRVDTDPDRSGDGHLPARGAKSRPTVPERGLSAALSDDPRPKPPTLLDAKQQAAIVAMVCGPPPPGHARWTVVLTAQEAQQRGVVRKVGRETIRRLCVSHALKPWREKNVVRAAARPGVPGADGSGAGSAEPSVG